MPSSLFFQLDTVESVTLSNAAIVTGYILPNAWHLARDEDVSVRTAYATAVSSLADVGSRFLEISESLRTQGLHLAQTDDLISPSNEVSSSRIKPSSIDHSRSFFILFY